MNELAWVADGSALLMDAGEHNSYLSAQLYEVAFPGGHIRKVTNDLNNYSGASLAENSSALLTVQTDSPTSIWVLPEGRADRARQISTGSANNDGFLGATWTPDGRIVFSSYNAGQVHLWIMAADGSGRKQLTQQGQFNMFPAVSPDGKSIVFASDRSGSIHIWKSDLDGGNPRELTRGEWEGGATFSPDGKWVLYQTLREDKSYIMKVPAEGGEPVQMSPRPGHAPAISPDGKWIAFHMLDESTQRERQAVIPFDGGEPVKLFDYASDPTWTRDSKGLYYRESEAGVHNLWLQPLDGGKPKRVTDFTSGEFRVWGWSSSGKQLFVVRATTTSDVILLRNFR